MEENKNYPQSNIFHIQANEDDTDHRKVHRQYCESLPEDNRDKWWHIQF